MRSKIKPRAKRAIHAAIATMMLTVPASAFAVSGTVTDTQAAPAPLSVHVTPRTTRLNQLVVVQGTAQATSAGHRVVLETASPKRTGWHALAATTIARSGRFGFQTRLRHTGYLRVLDAGPQAPAASVSTSLAQIGTGATSRPQRVAVAAQLAVKRHALDVLGGNAVTVGGWLRPGRAGRVVRVQGRSGRDWQTLATGRTGAAGRFRLRFTAATGLERRLRVRFAGDGANAATSRDAGRLTVYGMSVASWYNDGGNTACGFHAYYGVANRSLPCGTRVQFRNGGRTVTATVDDRGPYVGGREYDLNQNTAAALGFGGVGSVWASV